MKQQILAVLDAETRAVLGPHMERFAAAERELASAKQTLIVALRRLYPEQMLRPDATFDTERGVIWAPAPPPSPEEVPNGTA